MTYRLRIALASSLVGILVAGLVPAQTTGDSETNPLFAAGKVKNYLPHMTWKEVEDLLTRTDIAIIPVGALEQHGHHLPIGTDVLNGLERAKLIAQRVDALVVPILMAGNSPYHLGFPGTISLSTQTIQRVYVEAVESLIRHGFKRFLILNSHGGNRVTSRYIADRINHETAGIAVELGEASAPFRAGRPQSSGPAQFDRHGGVGETSNSLYLIPELVDLESAAPPNLEMLPHLEAMVPDILNGDRTALQVFLAEALKAEETGKGTSTREMTSTGVWSERDVREATVERGRQAAEATVDAAVAFIERWNELRPRQ